MKRGWGIKRLGDICSFQRGLTYTKNDEVEFSENCVLRSNNIDLETMSIILDELKYVRKDFIVGEDKIVKPNTILICMSNGSKQHIGKVAFIDRDYGYAFGGFMGLIIPHSTVFPKYVYYTCLSPLYKRFLVGIGNGANITNLKFSDLSNYTIPVPPLAEQERIVGELDLLSGVIAKKREQLTQLDALAQSIFYTMFGDPISNEKGWKKTELSNFAKLINGRAYKQEELLSEGKYPVLRVGNFFSSKDYYYSDLELSGDKYCNNGDLLYAWSASFGAKIWDGGHAIYHYHIWKVEIDNDKTDKSFLCYLLNIITKNLSDEMHGIAMMHLTKSGMEQTSFILPPLPLQQQFAEKIDAIEKQKERIRQSLTEVQQLFDSRMAFYFN